MITVATCFWEANALTAEASQGYEPHWVDRMARALRRHLTVPHTFTVFVDHEYHFAEPVEQRRLKSETPSWFSMIEPFQVDGPKIVLGLDTVICGSLDGLARYCLEAARIAIPRSPGKDFGCNGVVLCPDGLSALYDSWDGGDDMEHVRSQPHEFIDDHFPGWVKSYKCDVRPNGLGDARLVYFHGPPKMADLTQEPFVREHWR